MASGGWRGLLLAAVPRVWWHLEVPRSKVLFHQSSRTVVLRQQVHSCGSDEGRSGRLFIVLESDNAWHSSPLPICPSCLQRLPTILNFEIHSGHPCLKFLHNKVMLTQI